jgi:hypothetical protein
MCVGDVVRACVLLVLVPVAPLAAAIRDGGCGCCRREPFRRRTSTGNPTMNTKMPTDILVTVREALLACRQADEENHLPRRCHLSKKKTKT